MDKVSKEIKRLFGFLYLRAVRTGSRALSLERGSLLDVILRLRGSRAGLWEKAIERLRNLDIEKDATHLQPVLKSIEARLGRYIASDVDGRTTKLHVSQLTREHLRKTMAFFLDADDWRIAGERPLVARSPVLRHVQRICQIMGGDGAELRYPSAHVLGHGFPSLVHREGQQSLEAGGFASARAGLCRLA